MDKFPSRERATAATLDARVTVIVVARHMRADRASPLELCLRSALAEPWIDEVVVVSHDAPAAVVSSLRALQADRRDLKLVAAEAALTSAAAANLGAEHACGRWLLFLDADVVLRRGAVARLAAAGGEARAPWIVGGRLTNTAGGERVAPRTGALNAWSAIPAALHWGKARSRKHADAPARVAAVSGAFMLIARTDFDALAGFDEGFITDAADLDLCRRVTEAGGSVLFEAAASGVQFENLRRRQQAQGLARFASKSAKTPAQKAFAAVALPALLVLLWLRDFVAGKPPLRR